MILRCLDLTNEALIVPVATLLARVAIHYDSQ